MEKVFEFDNVSNMEEIIQKTWDEFKFALKNKQFGYTDIDAAKEVTFLKVFDDLFGEHNGIKTLTKTIGDIKQKLGRGTILKESEAVNYERFMPKKEFINESNRFSPQGIEWLYIALEDDATAIDTVKEEIRISKGERFGFCYFEFNENFHSNKIVDLTIADKYTYADFNFALEQFSQELIQRKARQILSTGVMPDDEHILDKSEFVPFFMEWSIFTYCKLLSSQIFVPLETDDKNLEYAPFQTLAQYFITKGYGGIIYKSTVCKGGKNLVLFDKNMAHPRGNIIDEIIK